MAAKTGGSNKALIPIVVVLAAVAVAVGAYVLMSDGDDSSDTPAYQAQQPRSAIPPTGAEAKPKAAKRETKGEARTRGRSATDEANRGQPGATKRGKAADLAAGGDRGKKESPKKESPKKNRKKNKKKRGKDKKPEQEHRNPPGRLIGGDEIG